MDPKKIWKDYYDSLLPVYLRWETTFGSDALPAFSGVLKVLSKRLGSFHFGLPEDHFGRSLLWGASHRGIFQRRGWQWSFDYFNADRSNVGVYGYDMPKKTVPIQFFTFDPDGRLELFSAEAQEPIPKDETKASTIGSADDLMTMTMSWNAQLNSDPNLLEAELNAKCNKMVADMYAEKQREDEEKNMTNQDGDIAMFLSHFDPPEDHLDLDLKDLISRQKHPEHLIAFYTSVATLRVSFAAGQKIKVGTTTQYDVIGQDGVKLLGCFIDLKRRAKRPRSLEFAVLGLKEGRKGVALMLLDSGDGVYYRVNWEWKLSQHPGVATWMRQDPVQRLIILG